MIIVKIYYVYGHGSPQKLGIQNGQTLKQDIYMELKCRCSVMGIY